MANLGIGVIGENAYAYVQKKARRAITIGREAIDNTSGSSHYKVKTYISYFKKKIPTLAREMEGVFNRYSKQASTLVRKYLKFIKK